MSKMGHHSTFRMFCLTLIFVTAGSGVSLAQKPGGTGGDSGAPKWGEYLTRFRIDPLLRKPFHMQPDTDIKGLASKIRSQELDIRNRKRAIRYLSSLDCTQFPEAKKQLALMLNPNDERWEEVRFEAAKGLRDMFSRHSCSPEVAEQAKKSKRDKTGADGKPCHCTTCCDADTLNILAKTAYEMDEKGCCYEPSLRVREMAVEAIKVCGIPCNFKPYYGTPNNEEPGPSAVSGQGSQNSGGGSGGEVIPDSPSEESVPEEMAPQASLPTQTIVPSPISRLTKVCIVSLAKGETRASDPSIQSVYRGRVYYFADEVARQEFESSPERFAVAFGGCDPVHFVQTHQPVEGRFLTEHGGKFYMFLSKDNVEKFKANPDKFTTSEKSAPSVAVTAK